MEKSRLKENHIEHMTSVNTVSISADGSLCASDRKDGAVMPWGLSIKKPLYYTLETGSVVNARIFSPTRYWLCAATDNVHSRLGLTDKVHRRSFDACLTSANSSATPDCISLAWSADGNCLFSGYTDSLIRVWKDIQPNPATSTSLLP
jgi:guanine nucleotide-binding protein subunit beta-2-like 1 protein